MIDCNSLTKSFQGKVVLDALHLTVERGEILAIMGTSGCGKTVLIQHMAGLLVPDAGTVSFDGKDLATMNYVERRRFARRIGYMFQLGALFDSMNVFDNLALPLVEHERLTSREMTVRIRETLGALDLAGVEMKMPHELSGGMLKRVGLARAMILSPEVLFCDEPTAGLDPVRAKIVYELIGRVRDKFKTTVVVVTHDTGSVTHFADRIALMRKGKIATVEKNFAQLSSLYQDFTHGAAMFLEGAADA